MMHPAFLAWAVLLVSGPAAALAQLSTLKEVIDGQDDLTTLSSVLTQAGFDDAFDDPSSDLVTLCSPVNEAFDRMAPERLEQLLEDQFVAHLRDVLEFHGVPGKVFAEQVTDGLVAPTLNDQELTFEFADDPVTGQTLVFVRTPNTPGSQVIEVNLEASNGIAHKVSEVFLPDFWDKNLTAAIDRLDDAKYGTFKDLFALSRNTFTALLESGVATVLAPTNQALLDALGGQESVDALRTDVAADIREAVLAAHIILNQVLPSRIIESDDGPTSVDASDGSTIEVGTETTTTANGTKTTLITLNDIFVSEADQLANNGLIHGIDGVNLPSFVPSLPCNPIATIACTTEGFGTLCSAVQAAGLEDALNTETFTVFAPTDSAWTNLPNGTVDALLNDLPSLTHVLLFHAVADKEIWSADLECTELIEMANGEDSRTYCVDGKLFQKGAGNTREKMPEITAADIVACNGVVHTVSEVMLPPDVFVAGAPGPLPGPPPPGDCASITDIACNTTGFSTLCAALQATSLAEALGSHDDTFTVFAPNDSAFGNLPSGTVEALLDDIPALTDILLFHAAADAKVILSSDLGCTKLTEMANGNDSRTYCVDGKLFQKGAGNSRDAMPEIIYADTEACNGVVHVVSEVMLPPNVKVDTSRPPPEDCALIGDIPCTTDGFSTLCTALQATGLKEALSSHDDTFTVFAPNDSAFANLSSGTVEALLDDIPALTDILLFHAVAEAEVILSSDLECTRLTEMANGEDSRTYCVDGKLFQKGSGNSREKMPEIISADIEACNGVVHVVSEVMLP